MGKLNGSYSAGTKRAGFTSSSVRTFVIGSLAEERLYGPDRYGTMTENVRKGFPDGCDTVVLASGENWPDALAASALAGMKSLSDSVKIIRMDRDESIFHIGSNQRIVHQDLPCIRSVDFLQAQDPEHLQVDEDSLQMIGIRHAEGDNSCADRIDDILDVFIFLLLAKDGIGHIRLDQQDRVPAVIQIIILESPVHVTNPGITRLVNELTEMNAVKKMQDSKDKRVFTVSLTPLGQKYHKKYLEEYHNEMACKLSDIPEKDIRTAAGVIHEAYRILSDGNMKLG